ncbi:MAG: Coenzyme F420 hydrogenase/dehydrogenase, beta subunit C-terminal domain [Spirochaetota bacterium]
MERYKTMIRAIRSLQDVVDWRMCIGCGTCRAFCPPGSVELVNVIDQGIRPRIDTRLLRSRGDGLDLCPGFRVDGNALTGVPSRSNRAEEEIGPVLEIWEGYAADPQIRYQGSSGGLLTAISLYCMENEDVGFVLHAGMDPVKPWLNRTHRSSTREELLAHTGSRYAPASPCEGLGWVEHSDRPCVVVGKPCDTAGVELARRKRPALDRNLFLVLSFFCAGTPSTGGTLDLLESLGIDPGRVRYIRYRGESWPGGFLVRFDEDPRPASARAGGETGPGAGERFIPYAESWGRLAGFRPLRCNLCPDGLGRVADLTCGDAWHTFERDADGVAPARGGDPGRSILLVRTERGREIARRARERGYLELTPISPEQVLLAQPNLLEKRRQLYGRLLGLRLFCIPTPRYTGFSLLRSWLRLPLVLKARTVLGTARRVLLRKWWRRQRLHLPA